MDGVVGLKVVRMDGKEGGRVVHKVEGWGGRLCV